jgi:hypothetical protein
MIKTHIRYLMNLIDNMNYYMHSFEIFKLLFDNVIKFLFDNVQTNTKYIKYVRFDPKYKNDNETKKINEYIKTKKKKSEREFDDLNIFRYNSYKIKNYVKYCCIEKLKKIGIKNKNNHEIIVKNTEDEIYKIKLLVYYFEKYYEENKKITNKCIDVYNNNYNSNDLFGFYLFMRNKNCPREILSCMYLNHINYEVHQFRDYYRELTKEIYYVFNINDIIKWIKNNL